MKKKYSSALILTLTLSLAAGCASCKPVKDIAPAPAVLSQERILIRVAGITEAGISGVSGANTTFEVHSFGKGTITLRGLDNCGFVTSGSTTGNGWVTFDTASLPQSEFCLYNLQADTAKFDAPAIGHFMVRRFLNINVKPLEITANLVKRMGVNWVQVAGGNYFVNASSTSVTMDSGGGINEDRTLSVNLGGNSGRLNITGPNGQTTSTFYTNAAAYTTTIDELFQGSPVTSGIFTITANHTGAVAQSATLLIKVYDKFGSFLSAPIINGKCFTFTDPYIAGMSVNGRWSTSSSLCARDTAPFYEVEGVTSNQRIFYGISDGTSWSVQK